MADQILARRPAYALGSSWPLVVMAGALAWFVLPLLGATYNEGFQATIVLNARAILAGDLAGIDPLHGLDNDFMLYSRFGVSVLLAGLLKLGLPAAAAFRLVMLGSLLLLVGTNAWLLVWRYRLPPVLACLPSLLFPGLFESGWFFNDNVLSAALTSAALLLFWRGSSLAASAGAAALWGLAVACRSDAVLVAPAFAVVAWWSLPGWGARLRHAAVAGPVAVAVPVLIYAVFGLHLLDIVPLTRRATELWARTDGWAQVLQQVLKGFSLPGLLALGIGAAAVILRRRWRAAMLCLGVPLVYAACYGRMLTEVRYLLPLSPFFGIAMAEAWEGMAMAGMQHRRLARHSFALLAVLCLVPPVVPPIGVFSFMAADHDMPRPTFGRFWSPIEGMAWNAQLAAGRDALAGALQAQVVPGRVAVVISAYWTPDRMVDLLLREAGFALAPVEAAACRQGGERFVRGDTTVLHLRAHLPMFPGERAGVNWELWGVPCLQALGTGPETPLLVVGWTQAGNPLPGLTGPDVTTSFVPRPGGGLSHFIQDRRYGYFVATAPARVVPSLLQQPRDALQRRDALAAAADPRSWSPSLLLGVHQAP